MEILTTPPERDILKFIQNNYSKTALERTHAIKSQVRKGHKITTKEGLKSGVMSRMQI